MPKSVTRHSFGQRPARQLARDFTTKRVVAKKNISDSSDENSFHSPLFTDFDFIGCIKKAMARLAHHAEIATGIVVQHQGELHTAFDILLDGFDHRNFSIERHVHDIRAFLRANADAIARFHLHAADRRAFQTRARIKKILVRRTRHCASRRAS